MAYTKNGALHLTKTERKTLEIIKTHTQRDISYGGGGTFSKLDTDKHGDYLPDTKDIKSANIGIELIDFILSIT